MLRAPLLQLLAIVAGDLLYVAACELRRRRIRDAIDKARYDAASRYLRSYAALWFTTNIERRENT